MVILKLRNSQIAATFANRILGDCQSGSGFVQQTGPRKLEISIMLLAYVHQAVSSRSVFHIIHIVISLDRLRWSSVGNDCETWIAVW